MTRRNRILAAGGIATCALALLVAPLPAARAQSPLGSSGGAAAPDSFNVDIAATPMLIEISAPAVLPLDVLAGIAYSQVGLNSQPRVQSTAGPAFVPLLSDAALLGGPAGVLATVVRLTPGLVVGLPSLFGLPPLPVDPTLVDTEPVARVVSGLPVPDAPPLGCTSYFPDVPREVSCGGPVQSFFGFELGATTGRSVSGGEEGEPASLFSRSDAKVTGISPSEGNTLTPFRAGSVASSAESRVTDGRLTAVAASQASDIDVGDGALRVDEVEASYRAAMGGTPETFEQSDLACDIGAVRAGGEEISLNEGGITLGPTGVPSPVDPAAEAVAPVLGELGGEVGDADVGRVTVTPNPERVSETSPDGTQVRHTFGCLEIRYRIEASGTDVRITLGNVAVTMSAFEDAPFGTGPDVAASPSDASAPAAPLGTTSDVSAGSRDLATPPATAGPTDAGLPELLVPGAEAGQPSTRPFLQTSGALTGWGIDGGWMAPFSLLALSLPVLAKARRFSPTALRR